VDANILFAALIRQNVTYGLFFEEKIILYSPYFILDELEKKKIEILQKNSSLDFKNVFAALKRRIRMIVTEKIKPYFPEADLISPDPNDSVYFALALYLKIPIWSNDKELKKQNKIKIYNTEEVTRMVGK
jgi:predicted nucleic acid-binding protein